MEKRRRSGQDLRYCQQDQLLDRLGGSAGGHLRSALPHEAGRCSLLFTDAASVTLC